MKYCSRCGHELPLSDFGTNSSKKDGLQQYCREHMKAYRREHYAKNPAPYGQRARAQTAELRELVTQAKDRPCMDCGGRFPSVVMDFDHVGEDKIREISSLVKYGNRQKLLDEIAKCELVCANCHRIRTHSRLTASHPSQ